MPWVLTYGVCLAVPRSSRRCARIRSVLDLPVRVSDDAAADFGTAIIIGARAGVEQRALALPDYDRPAEHRDEPQRG